MSRAAQLTLSKTRDLPKPNEYVKALYGECKGWAFDEVDGPKFKSCWRSEVFGVQAEAPLDLEIGTGNGFHFARHARCHPDRSLIGVELKYKPLIQSIRRCMRQNSNNARIVRFNAALVDRLFDTQELDNVFIHFPDPWSKKRQSKHRLIQPEFLKRLYVLQKPGSFLEFKTDNRDYFFDAIEKFKASSYQQKEYSEDLHNSEWAEENFITHFERIFLRQNLPIYFCKLWKQA